MFLTRFIAVMMSMSVSFLPLSIFSDLFGQKETVFSYEVYSNIEYGFQERNKMDIYVPENANQREYNGAILYIHGGSWTSGNKEDMNENCIKLAEKGYITATMNYTLVSETGNANAFTMLDEVDLAIKRLKHFSDEKNLNITKLATSGYSAGGHISALYAYTRPQDSAIELVFTANQVGPSDFHPENWDGQYGEGMAYSLVAQLAGVRLEDISSDIAEDIIVSVSPACNITSSSVPSLVAYGGTDMIVPKGNADATKKALEENGVEHTFILYPLSNHGLKLDPTKAREYDETLVSFCEKFFGYNDLKIKQEAEKTETQSTVTTQKPIDSNKESTEKETQGKPISNSTQPSQTSPTAAQEGSVTQSISQTVGDASIQTESINQNISVESGNSSSDLIKIVLITSGLFCLVLIVSIIVGIVLLKKQKHKEKE